MPLIINKPLSDSEAAKAAKPTLWRGWFSAEFREASNTETKRGDPMIAVWLAVFDGEQERIFRDWFTAAERGAARLRHASESVGAVLAQYEAGELSAEMFTGPAKCGLMSRKGAPGSPPVR